MRRNQPRLSSANSNMIVLSYLNDDDEEVEFEVPFRWEICSRCRGEGKHVNPAIDGNGISPEEFREDPDFEEAYFSGVYDIPCEEACNDGKVRIPDQNNFTEEQQKHYEIYLKGQESLDYFDKVQASEQWMYK